MRVATMRAVDRGLGRPLAALLTLVRRLTGDAPPPPASQVRKVLFVKLSEMGALVLATPAFAEARRVFPTAEPWVVCFDENVEIARLAGGFPAERIVAVRSGGLLRTLFGLLGAVRRLRRERFDVCVDLEYFSRVSAILSFLSRSRARVGFHRFEAEGLYCGDLYTHRVAWNPYLHVAQLYVVLVRAAAADPRQLPLLKERPPWMDELTFPRFAPDAADTDAVRRALAAAGVPGAARLVLVNPNSSDLLPLRRWPQTHFVELVRLVLADDPAIWVVLTGAPSEAPLAETILAALRALGAPPRCVSLVGRTTLRQLLTLFTMAEVLVSADSGPPHFAALTQIRGVTLFGPETPRLYGPVTTRNQAIAAGLACSPCIHAWNQRVSPCDDNRCMQLITPEEAADAALSAASAQRAATSASALPNALRAAGSGSTPPSSGS
jgi:ADP-heptose:LPS heptosyltransferase